MGIFVVKGADLLKNPIIELYYKYINWKYGKLDKEMHEEMEVIFGIKAWDDLTEGNQATLYSMNDIEIIYYKKENKYGISIETMYSFEDGRNGEKKYIQQLLNQFTEWMIQEGYDINEEVWIYNIFTDGYNINTKFDTIEELYACFKMLVNGFISE